MFSFPRGGAGVPCPPLCALVAPSFAVSGRDLLISGTLFKDPCDSFGRMFWGSWGFGVGWRLWLGLGSPGALNWIGLSWHRLPTAGSGRLSCVPAPWYPGCTGVWPTPNLWQSYSWHIRTSVSRVTATLLWGNWLSSSG